MVYWGYIEDEVRWEVTRRRKVECQLKPKSFRCKWKPYLEYFICTFCMWVEASVCVFVCVCWFCGGNILYSKHWKFSNFVKNLLPIISHNIHKKNVEPQRQPLWSHCFPLSHNLLMAVETGGRGGKLWGRGQYTKKSATWKCKFIKRVYAQKTTIIRTKYGMQVNECEQVDIYKKKNVKEWSKVRYVSLTELLRTNDILINRWMVSTCSYESGLMEKPFEAV